MVSISGSKKLKGEKIDVYIPSSNVLIIGLNTDDDWRKNKLEGHKPKATPKEPESEKPKETKAEKPKETKSKKSSKLKTKGAKD